jgi:hypothetical protein
VKEIQAKVYQAFDGKTFVSEAECADHEAKNWLMQFVGLTIEQVEAGIDRDNTDIADAFEKAGQRIARKRLADGERRRVVTKRERNVPDNADAQKRVEESRPLISTGDERRETDEVA